MTIYVTKKKRNTKRRPINNRRTKRRNTKRRNTKRKYGGMEIENENGKKLLDITPQSAKSYEVLKDMIKNADELSVISYDSGYGFVFLLKTSNINTKQDDYFIRHSVETPVEKMIIKLGFFADGTSDYSKRNASTEEKMDEELLKPNQIDFRYTRKYIAQIKYFHEEPDTQYQLFNAYPNHEIAFDVACAHLCKEDDDRTYLLDSLLNKTTAESNEKTIINSIIEKLDANPEIKLGVIAMDYAGNYINEETHTFKTLADLKNIHIYNIVYHERDNAIKKCYENENAIVISAFMMKGKDKYGNETNELKGFINIDAHEGNYLVNIPKRFIDEGKDSNQNKRTRYDHKEDFRVFAIDTGNVITMNYLGRLDNYTKNNYKTLTGRNYDYDYAFIKWIIIHWNITEDNLTGKETFIHDNIRLFFLHFINTFIISIEFILSYENDREKVRMKFHESPSSHIAKYLIEKDKDHRIWDYEFIKEMVDLLNKCIPPSALITMFGGRNTHYPTVIENIQNHLKNPVMIHPNIIDKYMRIYKYMTVINPKLPNEWMKLPNEDDEHDKDTFKPMKKKTKATTD